MRKLLIVFVILVLSISLVAVIRAPKNNSEMNIFPNPMEDVTSISFSVDQNSYVVLEVLDSKRKVVSTIVSEYLVAGNYVYEWHRVGNDGSFLKAGDYVVQVKEDKRFVTKRKTLILK
jgi:flagellar hook assembly protein FlgD